VRRAHIGAALAAIALGFTARTAHADKMTDAEELFRRAKALMAEKKEKEACPLFEESEKLDPQMGTLLNLAICHEAIGRVASAWGEYRAVEQMAQVAGRQDRVELAHKAAQKLEGRLPRLKITLPPENKVEGIVVKIDGEPKGEPLWSGVAIDPGTHNVETSAPGKKPNVSPVKIEKEGQVVPFTIPKLEDAPPEPAPSPTAEDPAEKARKRAEIEKQIQANKSRRTKGFVIGGAGIAVMAAGGVFGILAISKNSDASNACPNPCLNGSDAATQADNATDRALLFANVANVAIPIGALVTILGGYMILSAGPTTMPAVGLQPDPTKRTLLSRSFVTPSLGGATLGVTW
jgi:hypothetical protein